MVASQPMHNSRLVEANVERLITLLQAQDGLKHLVADFHAVEQVETNRHLSISRLLPLHKWRGRRSCEAKRVFANLNTSHESHFRDSKQLQPPRHLVYHQLAVCR